jgi:integrase
MNQVLEPLLEAGQRVPDFFFDPKTQIIYFWKSIENKKVKFSTRVKLPDIAKAKRIANKELRVRLNKKKIHSRTLIKDELELWLKVKEAEGLKYDTLNNVRRGKRQIEGFWGEKFPNEINRDTVTLWYQWWADNHPKIMMENAIKYMRNFCQYLAEKTVDGYPLLPAVPTIKDPHFKVNRAQRQKKKERIITPAEFKKILETAPDDGAKVVVLFMYTMASRITETLTLQFAEQILLDQELPVYRWSIGQNKADLWGQHFLHPSLIEPLKRLKARRASEGTRLLFPQKLDNQKALKEQQIDWQAWRDRAELGWKWTPHTFRHTCLSNIFNLPGDKRPSDLLLCKLYRVSLQIAMEHYVKPTQEGTIRMRDALTVDLKVSV